MWNTDTNSIESGSHQRAAYLRFEFEMFCHVMMPYPTFLGKPGLHVGTNEMRRQKPSRNQTDFKYSVTLKSMCDHLPLTNHKRWLWIISGFLYIEKIMLSCLGRRKCIVLFKFYRYNMFKIYCMNFFSGNKTEQNSPNNVFSLYWVKLPLTALWSLQSFCKRIL